jgi:hypothetical protein
MGISRDYPLKPQTSKQPIGEITKYEIIPSHPLKYPSSKQGLNVHFIPRHTIGVRPAGPRPRGQYQRNLNRIPKESIYFSSLGLKQRIAAFRADILIIVIFYFGGNFFIRVD